MSFVPAVAQDGGFGADIPLELALRQIVPAGTEVKLNDGVDSKVRVSWDGKGGWKKAVEQAAGSAGYVATMTDSGVTISRAGSTVKVADTKPQAKPAAAAPKKKPAAPKKPAAAPVVEVPVVSGAGFVLIPEGAPTGANAGGKGGGWTDYNGGPSKPAAQAWVVKPGDDLYATLSEWAEREGWRLVWESGYRYQMTSAAKFSGTFVAATTDLLRSMQEARPVITAQFYEGNKVLVVGNDGLDEAN